MAFGFRDTDHQPSLFAASAKVAVIMELEAELFKLIHPPTVVAFGGMIVEKANAVSACATQQPWKDQVPLGAGEEARPQGLLVSDTDRLRTGSDKLYESRQIAFRTSSDFFTPIPDGLTSHGLG
jgi:hypothetical protein